MIDSSALAVYHLSSKRCVKCGIHPEPSQMVLLWGYGWERETQCLSCRKGVATPPEHDTYLVIMVPKLKGRPTKDIKDSWLRTDLRAFAKEQYRSMGYRYRLYLSDGDRFWNWVNFPYNMDRFVKWDEFVAMAPDWKVIRPEVGQTYPEIRDYVSC